MPTVGERKFADEKNALEMGLVTDLCQKRALRACMPSFAAMAKLTSLQRHIGFHLGAPSVVMA